MSDINFIIAQKEDLKTLIYQWLDEHPISKFKPVVEPQKPEKPMSRVELAEYLGISKITVTDWIKKGLPHRRMSGRVFFIREEVLDAMKTFNRRKKNKMG
jgi:excisionase family DNA binding protein